MDGKLIGEVEFITFSKFWPPYDVTALPGTQKCSKPVTPQGSGIKWWNMAFRLIVVWEIDWWGRIYKKKIFRPPACRHYSPRNQKCPEPITPHGTGLKWRNVSFWLIFDTLFWYISLTWNSPFKFTLWFHNKRVNGTPKKLNFNKKKCFE